MFVSRRRHTGRDLRLFFPQASVQVSAGPESRVIENVFSIAPVLAAACRRFGLQPRQIDVDRDAVKILFSLSEEKPVSHLEVTSSGVFVQGFAGLKELANICTRSTVGTAGEIAGDLVTTLSSSPQVYTPAVRLLEFVRNLFSEIQKVNPSLKGEFETGFINVREPLSFPLRKTTILGIKTWATHVRPIPSELVNLLRELSLNNAVAVGDLYGLVILVPHEGMTIHLFYRPIRSEFIGGQIFLSPYTAPTLPELFLRYLGKKSIEDKEVKIYLDEKRQVPRWLVKRWVEVLERISKRVARKLERSVGEKC